MKRIVKYAITDRDERLDLPYTIIFNSLKDLKNGIKKKLDSKDYSFEIEMLFLDPNDRNEMNIMTHRQLFYYNVNDDSINIYQQRNIKHKKECLRVISKLTNLVTTYSVLQQ
jgi:hypothetical protein